MATDQKSKSKRVGSTKRAEAARRDLKVIFSDEENPMYLAKDIVFARKYDVTRLTISKIRDEMGVPRRSKRLIERLKKIKTKDLTVKEIAERLSVKHQNLYRLITMFNIPVKPDVPPIEALKTYNHATKGMKKKKKSEA
jgi:hypothetical protein